MACRYTYQGKTYTAAEFIRVLSEMPPVDAARFMPKVKSIPNAPIVNNTDEWAMLAFKRVVREAVDAGKSVIAWTTGEQQADRYNLAKQVEFISSRKRGDEILVRTSSVDVDRVIQSSGNGRAYTNGGGGTLMTAAQIMDVFGSDLGRRIIEGSAGEGSTISGDGLKIGGEGMRAFYDKILPAAVNKWAKKFGGRTSSTALPEFTGTKSPDAMSDGELLDALNEPAGGLRVHSLEITPAMREAASGPMPLFQRRSVPQARAEAAAKRAEAASSIGTAINGGAIGWDAKTGNYTSWKGRRWLREGMQDKFISLRDLQGDIEKKLGMPLADAQNVYRLENLMHGRVQDGILKIERQHLEPLFDAMKKAKVSHTELEAYLEARHAEERNKQIAKINAEMPDGGSGMTTAEARKALAGMDRAKLEPLARRIDAIVKETRARLLSSGIITQAQHDAMENAYDFYVPLRGKEEADAMEVQDRAGGSGLGRGIEQRTSGIKKAAGRGAGNRAKNILGEVMADAQRSVIAAEKARVGRALMRLVLANPNPNLWQVEAVRTERKFDAQGNVYEAIVNESAEPDVIHALIEGKPYRIRIANAQIIESLKNLGANNLHDILRPLAAMNRYVSATLTSYNPTFTLVNMSRDAAFGTIRILAEDGPVAYGKTVANYGPAMTALAMQEARSLGKGKMADRLREFLGAGGKTGWVSMNAVEDLQKSVALDTSRKPGAYGMRSIRAIGRFVESANVVVENAMRLAYFSALRDGGMSVEQAAEKAKNLTVNFNRKGKWANAMSAAYLFFNPAIQGSHQVVKLAKNPKAMAFVGTMAAVQAAMALMAAGIEDEDGERLSDKVPDYVKERNLWMVIPGERGPDNQLLEGEEDRIVTLPMPFGFNALTYSASVGVDLFTKDMPEIANGTKSVPGVAVDVVGKITNAFVGALSPVPLNDGLAGLVPTIPGQVVTGLISNQDSLGRPIRQMQFDPNNPEPRAFNGRPDTAAPFVAVAQGLNWLGGGDEVRVPARPFDWAPEDIKYMYEWATGGAGRFVNEVISGSYNMLADPEALEGRPLPLIRPFTQPINEPGAAMSAFYERANAIELQERRIRGIAERDGVDAAQDYADTVPFMAGVVVRERGGSFEIRPGGSDLYDAYRRANREMKGLRDEQRNVWAEEGTSLLDKERAAKLRDIRERQAEAVKDVLLYWNEATRPLEN